MKNKKFLQRRKYNMGNKKMEETRSEILENNRWTKVAWKGATEEYART